MKPDVVIGDQVGGGTDQLYTLCICTGSQAGIFQTFSGFSVGCCINREKVICYQLEFGK